MAIRLKKTKEVLDSVEFILSIDAAIGDEADYTQYINTLDRKFLDLKKGILPTIFYLKPLTAKEYQVFAAAARSSEDSTKSDYQDKLSLISGYTEFVSEVVASCVIGVKNLEIYDESGEVKTYNWKPGREVKEETKLAILQTLSADIGVGQEIRTAIQTFCGLTVAEKKP